MRLNIFKFSHFTLFSNLTVNHIFYWIFIFTPPIIFCDYDNLCHNSLVTTHALVWKINCNASNTIVFLVLYLICPLLRFEDVSTVTIEIPNTQNMNIWIFRHFFVWSDQMKKRTIQLPYILEHIRHFLSSFKATIQQPNIFGQFESRRAVFRWLL